MKALVKICLLLLPLFSQGQTVVVLDSALNNKWVTLDKNWHYQKGDNKEWASPTFVDSTWKVCSFYNLNMPDGKNAIANRGEFVWFRTQIKTDSTLNKAIVLNIAQFGASEIYLDGKLIHQLGTLSKDINQVIYKNPRRQILELPLEKGKQQVLAIRYVNAQYKFPIYSNTNGLITIAATTLSNANSNDVIKNRRIAYNRRFLNNYHITLGIAILIFIIFSSYYIFFPNEKVNGYFAIGMFFLIPFCTGVIWGNGYEGDVFWIKFCHDTSCVVGISIFIYCTYLIFHQRVDIFYKIIVLLGILSIACFFLYEPDTLAQIWSILARIVIIIMALKLWKNNRFGSVLFIVDSLIFIVFWSLFNLYRFGLVQINVGEFIPFALMSNPIFLSIYLGYNFGKRSQDLRLNLERVQKLSKEKQSILFLQNEKLETQVQERTASLNRSLADLKSTQAQLIQSEKLASLGELTAGIAHEIQNPLNFVNNFSELSVELIEEAPKPPEGANENWIPQEAPFGGWGAFFDDLTQNLQKINQHGKRASSIVSGMLEHSRNSTGERVLTDINKLADEYLRLSYHGIRAKDSSFNADFELIADPNLPKINIIPQDMGRVLLNLINNAFQSQAPSAPRGGTFDMETKRQHKVVVKTQYMPAKDSTSGGWGAISITDNGTGIPEDIKAKIFQPFFTTKPTGQGTGLGLSLAYDIVKAHGGEIKVTTIENEGLPAGETGTEFTIQLPIK